MLAVIRRDRCIRRLSQRGDMSTLSADMPLVAGYSRSHIPGRVPRRRSPACTSCATKSASGRGIVAWSRWTQSASSGRSAVAKVEAAEHVLQRIAVAVGSAGVAGGSSSLWQQVVGRVRRGRHERGPTPLRIARQRRQDGERQNYRRAATPWPAGGSRLLWPAARSGRVEGHGDRLPEPRPPVFSRWPAASSTSG